MSVTWSFADTEELQKEENPSSRYYQTLIQRTDYNLSDHYSGTLSLWTPGSFQVSILDSFDIPELDKKEVKEWNPSER